MSAADWEIAPDLTHMTFSPTAETMRREQTERQRKGLCRFCGLSLRECGCGEDEPVEYRPVSDGSDEGSSRAD